MDYFWPQLANGRRVSLPIQFVGYKLNFLWPLQENAPRPQEALKQVATLLSLLCYAATIVAEFAFIGENISDIPAVTECLSTTFMGIQYFIRIALMAAHQGRMRRLLERFYRDIFFASVDETSLYGRIRLIARFIWFFTLIYWVPMILIFVMFAGGVVGQGMASLQKPYFYSMSFVWYDAQRPLAYVLTSLYTGWLTLSCVTLMAADDYILCLMLCHTSFRYKQLQLELDSMLAATRHEVRGGKLHETFHRKLYDVFRRQQQLDSFVQEAKTHFSNQIFYCLAFGVLLLCFVSFQFQKTDIGIGWVKYIVWLISQTSQFIMIGFFGQMLMDETSAMHNSFYKCHWEQLLPYGDARTNKSLMDDIRFAIFRAEHAVVFDGMKIFPLTHSTVGSALRAATSYFMFLKTMNEAQ